MNADDVPVLDPRQLGVYFVLTEAVSLLQHQIEQQLRAEGGLSYVQFQLLARLAEAPGPLTMTQLADGVVYSRSVGRILGSRLLRLARATSFMS